MRKLAVTVLCLSAVGLVSTTAQADVLIAGAANPDWVAEVASTVMATGLIENADTFDLRYGTPTLEQLQQYTAVMAFTDYAAQNADLLGNNLADYVDGGGGVVQAVFSFHTSIPIGGRWQSDGYSPLTYGSQNSGTELYLGTVYEPGHAVLANVESFSGGTASYHNTVNLAGGATLIADWTNGVPLIAEQTGFGGGIIGLNFYPPSDRSRSDFWRTSTDGDLLMANALVYVPEPATLGLLGIGAIALLRRR